MSSSYYLYFMQTIYKAIFNQIPKILAICHSRDLAGNSKLFYNYFASISLASLNLFLVSICKNDDWSQTNHSFPFKRRDKIWTCWHIAQYKEQSLDQKLEIQFELPVDFYNSCFLMSATLNHSTKRLGFLFLT